MEGFFEGRPLSIWEMRNPSIFMQYAEIICHYNFSPLTTQAIAQIHPLNKQDLFIHTVINQWGPKLEQHIPEMKAVLTEAMGCAADQNELSKNMATIDNLQKTFLF